MNVAWRVLALMAIVAATACAESAVPPAAAPLVIAPMGVRATAVESAEELVKAVPVSAAPDEHWYFEALAADGKRALLRRLDPAARSTFHVRVVDVDTGLPIEEARLGELARIPASTIGGQKAEIADLEWRLASPAFAADIVHGGRIASAFPFGACGRVAAGKSAIAFDAGDWLYVADEDGRVRRRLVEEAAYDPRFTPDGKFMLFRRATGTVDGLFAKYELFVVPSDLSAPPRALPGTAGMHDRFVAHPDGQTAFAIASQARGGRGAAETCVTSLALRPPFATKKLACLEGSEQVVDSVISPKGKWAALSTKKHDAHRTEWRLRIVSLVSGKTVRDEPETPGLGIRAMSDAGLLVQSGALGTVVTDVPARKHRDLDRDLDIGHRGVFRNDRELVYVTGGSVTVLDVTRD